MSGLDEEVFRVDTPWRSLRGFLFTFCEDYLLVLYRTFQLRSTSPPPDFYLRVERRIYYIPQECFRYENSPDWGDRPEMCEEAYLPALEIWKTWKPIWKDKQVSPELWVAGEDMERAVDDIKNQYLPMFDKLITTRDELKSKHTRRRRTIW